MDTTKSTAGKAFKLSVMTLAIMNITAVVSLRGLPAEAVYGLSSAFYYLFAAIVFLIPTAMVAAELAAMFSDKQGGVFRWVGEAFGPRTGFLAIWLQWIESTIWYPTVLTFGAVSMAFIGMNDAHDASLASNKLFTLVIVLAIYWKNIVRIHLHSSSRKKKRICLNWPLMTFTIIRCLKVPNLLWDGCSVPVLAMT